jgi:hypothetical protein
MGPPFAVGGLLGRSEDKYFAIAAMFLSSTAPPLLFNCGRRLNGTAKMKG